jgi:diguanylate cyclase (GGDEF)-like protein
LIELVQIPAYAILLVAAASALAVFLVRGAFARRKLHQQLTELTRKLERAEARIKEQTGNMARMRSEQGTVASLALSLPAVVRELNRADLEPRRVPGLIMQLAESIFRPSQILFYRAVDADVPGERPELRLIKHQGIDNPEQVARIPFGQGKIGWVAEHKLDMLKDDWFNPGRTEGMRVVDTHPGLELDIVGPLVNDHIGKEQVLGVLCIGAPGVPLRDEKLMFQLLTNLASLAMVNAVYRSKFIEQANHDGLTGLLNKRSFLQQLPPLIFQADRQARPLALFLFDIDHFKNYNDTNGHPAGDELLRELARLLKQNVRPGDWCCRYGGEEFIVAMPDTDGPAAMLAAERIRKAIEGHEFEHQARQPNGNLTISGGLAVLPSDGVSIEELTSHADQALYESKRRGRNRTMRYRGIDIGDGAEDVDRPSQSDPHWALHNK